jgi:hypothetical protein
MLVNRWGLMRRAFSSQITLKKIDSLLICLCRLHNFCIDQRLAASQEQEDVPVSLHSDAVEISSGGGIPLEESDRHPELNKVSAEQLLHGGEHFDDVPRTFRRRLESFANLRLPRDVLHDSIVDKCYKRPLPNSWRNKETIV